jgi:hypothetical protein
MKNHVTEAMTMTSARANRLAESKGAGRYAGGVPVRFRNALDNPLYASDVGLIVALVLALLFVTDPLGLPFERITATKHFPLAVGGLSLLMAATAAALHPGRDRLRPGARLARMTAPFTMLAGWIIAGSLYARHADGIQETFLTVGLYMLAVPGVALFIVSSAARWRVVGVYMRALSVAAAFMILRMLAEHVTSGGMYHELEYLVAPVGVFHALRPRSSNRWKVAFAAFYLLGGLTFLKLTGFLALGIALAYLWIVDWRFRFAEDVTFRRRATRCMVVAALAGALAAAAIMHRHEKTMPDGNLGYRLVTYRSAVTRFVASPLFGTSFAAPATSQFTNFRIAVAHGNLPTHSDLLDLAANGGVLALGLLICAYTRIWRCATRTILATRVKDDIVAAAHALACTTVTGVFVYAFNPILLEPDRALLLWADAGLLLGMAICYKQRLNPVSKGA